MIKGFLEAGEASRYSKTRKKSCTGRILISQQTHSSESSGPSAAGKTTLLNCLAGYASPYPSEGLLADGQAVYSELEYFRSQLGYVTQDDVLYDGLTVAETPPYAAQLRFGRSTSSDRAGDAVDRALELVGLIDVRDKRPSKLSGGQRKRLSVAIELLRPLRLLLLDEPTSGLDPANECALMSSSAKSPGRVPQLSVPPMSWKA